MLEKPDIPDANLIACLRQHYALEVSAVEFMPLGNAPDTWAYRVDTADNTRYFMKVKRGAVDPAVLLVPRFLRDSGLDSIVAPILAESGDLWVGLDDYSLILMPFIDGSTGMDLGLSDAQCRGYGAVLRAIHDSQPPPDLLSHLQREKFIPPYCATIQRLHDEISAQKYDEPIAHELAQLWRKKAAEILRLVERCESVGRQWQQTQPGFVLCHCDIHTANLLIDVQGQLHVVDWDDPRLAPKERDLMFIVGSDQTKSREESLFVEGYGPVEVDLLGIAYYRHEWVLQEFADYGVRILWAGVGEATRRDALQQFRQLFDPGDVVDAAYQSDERLSAGSGGTAT